MRRGIALFLILTMVLALAGCSSEELGFLSLSQEINLLPASETTGTVSVTMNGDIIDEAIQNMPAEFKELQSVIKSGFEIRYNSKQSNEPLAFDFSLEFRKKGDAGFKKVTSICGNEEFMYIKLGELLGFVKNYICFDDPEEEKAYNEIMNKADYLELNLKTGGYQGIYQSGALSQQQNDRLQKMMLKFTDLFKDIFSGFSTGMVSRKGNGYELKLEAKDIKPLLIKFIEYIVENINEIVDKASERINAMTDEEIEELQEVFGGMVIDREEMVQSLEMMRFYVKQTAPEELERMKDYSLMGNYFEQLDGSSINYYIGKTTGGTYEENSNIKIKYDKQLDAEINSTGKMKKLSGFSMIKPSKYTTADEFKKIIYGIVPPKVKSLHIDTRTGKTILTYDSLKEESVQLLFILKDGSTYAALEELADILDEPINRDETGKAYYAIRSDQKIYLTGVDVNGEFYVKIKELQKLDYSVYWNPYTGEVTVWRSNDQSVLDSLKTI